MSRCARRQGRLVVRAHGQCVVVCGAGQGVSAYGSKKSGSRVGCDRYVKRAAAAPTVDT